MTNFSNRRAALTAVLLFVLGAPAASGKPPSYLIIVHPNNPVQEVDKSFLRNAFLKRTPQWPNNESIRPVDLGTNSQTREQFSNDVLGRRVAEVKIYWSQQIFSGKNVPPPELDSDAAVIDYVLHNNGAVGYVSEGSNPGGAKVVSVK